MNIGVLVRVLLCILTIGIFLYAYINKQNSITEVRLQIPILSKELQMIVQENTRLQFEIDQFENPQHLMELSREPRFSHLKYPLLHEIVVLDLSKEEECQKKSGS